jgi:hypothetical protein
VRARIFFGLLVVMLLALLYLVATRTRDPHTVPPVRVEAPPDAGEPDSGGTSASSSSSASPGPADGAADAPVGDAAMAKMDRPLRVVAASWDVVAPLVVAASADVQVEVVPGERDIEGRVVRGGADAEGADVAVMPLPSLVAAYERLRALEPQAVLVVGWSRGREVLLGGRDATLAKAPRAPQDVSVESTDDAAGALALFALDESGIPASRVHVVADPKGTAFAALARPLPAERAADAPSKVLLTTADASRLVPYVAVAPRGFADGHVDVLAAFARTWFDGAAALRKDVTAAARRISAQPGAPDPAALLERIGWIGDADGADAARALGLAGHDSVTIATLFTRTWKLLRDSGSLVSPAPPSAPVATAPFAKLLAADPKLGETAAAPVVAPANPDARVLLAHRFDKADVDTVVAEAAWLAGVFERSTLRISARPPSLAKDAAAAAHDKQGVATERLVVLASAPADGAAALVEVLAAP